jgi:hypothetical protein
MFEVRGRLEVARTASTEQLAAALHVKPATVRKYAREHRLPYDVTPGGHRRFDIEEAVAAVRANPPGGGPPLVDGDLPEPVPYVDVPPSAAVAVSVVVTSVERPPVVALDAADDVEDWASEHQVV